MGFMQPGDGVETPLTALLDDVLSGLRRDLPGEVGTAISVAHPSPSRGGGRLRVLAATGVGAVLPPITTGHLWGPSLLVAAGEEPIATADLWNDPRWPHLTLDAVRAQLPEQDLDVVSKVRGVAAVPGVWDGGGVVVLSAYLDGPADHRALAMLARHERLVASAIAIATIADRNADDAEQMLDALASRAIIEQAKGAIMMLRRCDADEAWAVLRRASQDFNVKLRELALALVEHIGRAPAEQLAGGDHPVRADAEVRRAAVMVWQALAGRESPGVSAKPRDRG
ncbi:ANTAR domain-containing protein [Amycolatopsis sp. YIM 10]|uniref:ANTAR domain-containing protein n=1 Tax=Amycolatopsis sp. YIM 10 TaxID=2653857 RepID=UPI0012906A79|nr:ANTAR domain-containing protein [Amycolatopsis sp. YIM 10]QFU91821.1 ANTAR domain protein [Amycolatopsis sp. YIM 10]